MSQGCFGIFGRLLGVVSCSFFAGAAIIVAADSVILANWFHCHAIRCTGTGAVPAVAGVVTCAFAGSNGVGWAAFTGRAT